MVIDPRQPLRPAEGYVQPMGPEQQVSAPTPAMLTTPELPSHSPAPSPEVPSLEMPNIEAPSSNTSTGDVLSATTEIIEIEHIADHLEVLVGQMISKKGSPGPLEEAFARVENKQEPPAA